MLQLHPFSFGLFIWTKFVRDVSDERSNEYICVAGVAAAAAAVAAVYIDAR